MIVQAEHSEPQEGPPAGVFSYSMMQKTMMMMTMMMMMMMMMMLTVTQRMEEYSRQPMTIPGYG